ncbi:hypothetical protein DPMN_158656 [Dreissena polymorpha]|uniref:Uncharacterized protein n=1 Tax=Dreissena polymorpha TaxID=45954 RepID=A0A9D3YNR1_DREPO|nr:hypothetical protein DPMN_078999 [Dreissena polymorpha]KAH3780834.1 hypothetical protein DPMN_158656 [Dreissena polymorpha]
MVTSFLAGEQTSWDLHLGSLAGAYRATPHEATGFSPNMMVTGREVRLQADIIYADPSSGGSTEMRNITTMQQA